MLSCKGGRFVVVEYVFSLKINRLALLLLNKWKRTLISSLRRTTLMQYPSNMYQLKIVDLSYNFSMFSPTTSIFTPPPSFGKSKRIPHLSPPSLRPLLPDLTSYTLLLSDSNNSSPQSISNDIQLQLYQSSKPLLALGGAP